MSEAIWQIVNVQLDIPEMPLNIVVEFQKEMLFLMILVKNAAKTRYVEMANVLVLLTISEIHILFVNQSVQLVMTAHSTKLVYD